MRFRSTVELGGKRWFVLAIEEAKTAATRKRRIAKAVDRLREGKGQRG